MDFQFADQHMATVLYRYRGGPQSDPSYPYYYDELQSWEHVAGSYFEIVASINIAPGDLVIATTFVDRNGWQQMQIYPGDPHNWPDSQNGPNISVGWVPAFAVPNKNWLNLAFIKARTLVKMEFKDGPILEGVVTHKSADDLVFASSDGKVHKVNTEIPVRSMEVITPLV